MKILGLRYRLAQLIWPEGFSGLDAANYPDLPAVAHRWTILDRGHWGTLGATKVGFDRVFVGVFKGYAQESQGVLLTPDNLERLKRMFNDPA